MIKKFALILIIFLCSFFYGFGQVTTIDFETVGSGYTPSTTIGAGWEDVFNRTDFDMSIINNEDGFYWAVEDIDGSPSIDLDQIDVTGSSSFTFSIDWIAHHFDDWDAGTEFSITYSLDNGAYQNLIWVRNICGCTNAPAAVDLGFDGVGDCGATTTLPSRSTGTADACTVASTRNQFETYVTNAIALSNNSSLDIRLSFADFSQADQGIYLDNIVITETSSCTPPADPIGTISGTTPACNSTTLSFAGTPPANVVYYWQTSASGVSTANNTTGTFNATSSNTYYVRAYNTVDMCWSAGNLSYAVVIETATPTITTQPTNQSVATPNTATFSVTATNAVSYQWEISTNGGTVWNNVTGGTGATTNSYTTPATTLAMNNDQYRCVVTNICGSLDSNPAVLTVFSVADVVIIEIMYNTPTPGSDDEWIEICNISGSTQDISNYIINIGATSAFTFPGSTTIANGDCITISLGSNGDGTFNNICPFVPDYGISAGTDNTNNLVNSSNTITLYAADGSTISDQVQYDDDDSNPTDGNGSSFHVIDAAMDNSDTDTNWTNVIDGGSPGTNSLVSPCTAPELQLVDSSNTDQACGYTIDFGSQATGFNTDIVFDIDNDGSSGLDISSLGFSGANPGDFSIVSPATPFTVTAGNTQTVTVRFSPSTNGNRTSTLTINNNDSDEFACTINLQGNGTTPAPEINVEGDLGTFPDIVNGDTTPSGTDNTLFAQQFIGNSQEKTFRIQNIGTDVLNISGVTVIGTNPGDFTISIAPASSVAVSGVTVFEVSFSPLAAGVREADIRIANDDSDEGVYTFRVRGTGNCVANAITISPTSGPEGTIVTVNGTNLNTASATFNGLTATVNNISATQIEVTVPAGATTGNLEIIDDLGCPGSEAFSVIDTQIGTCEGGSALSELFISEVTDATYGSLTYIEIYNATGSNVNLANYSISIYANGNTNPVNASNQTLNGTLNAGDTYVVTTGTFGVLGNSLCSIAGGDGTYGDLISTTLAGVNVGNGDDDYIGLYNNGTLIDELGVFGDDNWTSSTIITGDRGYDFRRLNTATPLPTIPFNTNQWNIIDWAGSGSSTCVSTNDYTNIGVYDFSTGTPATITVQPSPPSSDCDLTATITVTATEGFVGGNVLAYQWYFSAPGDTGWTAVVNNATYSGATSATLNILNTLTLDDYQYYCQVRENDALCYQASIATQLSIIRTTWTTGWDNGAPDTDKIAIIDGVYTTGINGSGNGNINACQLIINTGEILSVSNSSFVRVVNNVINNGTLTIQTQGAFVQDGDGAAAGTFVNNGSGTSSVNKTTDTFDSSISGNYNYTYWSSPVINSNVISVFPNPYGNRRYYFSGENYLDATQETGNNNGTTAGQDDIDDNGDDWQNATSTMDIGRGYAVTAVGPPMPDVLYSDSANFVGAYNTGDILVDVFKNDSESNDNNWNFIGNPYPSAISASEFLTENTFLDANPTAPIQGAIFLWSQGSPADAGNNGNEAWNFSQNDYAIINGAMGTAGGNGVSPDPYIPSGQGFFIAYEHGAAEIDANGSIKRNQVRFMNSMRETSNNGQFFEANGSLDQNRSDESNYASGEKLWLDLVSDNGVFSQIGVAYIENATNDYDGWYFDAPRNLSTNTYSILYTTIETSNIKFAIQGKNSSSLNSEEIISLGFKTIIEEATIYRFSIAQLEGEFLENNIIYVKDLYLDTIHNLSESDYSFTSEVGEFNDRFEIVFTLDPLSTDEFETDDNALSIIENTSGLVTFKLSGSHTMESIEIIDALGRTVYNLNADDSSERTFRLSKLSQATYIARVTLDNGYVITKKALKRK